MSALHDDAECIGDGVDAWGTAGSRRRKALETLEAYIPRQHATGDALVVSNVSLAFGGVRALRNVSVTVPARHFVGLIGPNGAGKSTLFDVMNGLKMPDEGAVHLFGHDVSKKQAWDRAHLGMGRTFQSNRLNPSLTVGENLLTAGQRMIRGGLANTILGLSASRKSERAAVGAARALTVLLDMEHHWDDRAQELDFGTQRRIEIACAIMTGPRLLLLDEPAAGLDAKEAAALFTLVRRIQADLDLTVVLVEHYVKAVLENADLVYVLSQGSVIAQGSPEEVTSDPRARAEYFGMGSAVATAHGTKRLNGAAANGNGHASTNGNGSARRNGAGTRATGKRAVATAVEGPAVVDTTTRRTTAAARNRSSNGTGGGSDNPTRNGSTSRSVNGRSKTRNTPDA